MSRAVDCSHVHRGLYATVPPASIRNHRAGSVPHRDAGTDDAIVAYHAALHFHGKAYSVSSRFTYLTGIACGPSSSERGVRRCTAACKAARFAASAGGS